MRISGSLLILPALTVFSAHLLEGIETLRSLRKERPQKSSLSSEKVNKAQGRQSRGNQTICLHRSGPLLENGLDRPKNRYGRYGFPSSYSISISTVAVDGARVCRWRFSFLALWIVVVDVSQFSAEILRRAWRVLVLPFSSPEWPLVWPFKAAIGDSVTFANSQGDPLAWRERHWETPIFTREIYVYVYICCRVKNWSKIWGF